MDTTQPHPCKLNHWFLPLVTALLASACGSQPSTFTPAPPVAQQCSNVVPQGITGPIEPPNIWQDLLVHRCFDELIADAKAVVPGDAYFPEAQLYLGQAVLEMGGPPGDAMVHLYLAEQNLDALTTVDTSREQLLLWNGQMIVYRQLADTYNRSDLRARAENYMHRALNLANPLQATLIYEEFSQGRYDSDIQP